MATARKIFFENNIGRRIITINKKAKSAKKESNVANKKGDSASQ